MEVPTRYLNKDIYRKAKREADSTYKKPSAYKSAYLVKRYKELGGKLASNKPTALTKWFQEDRWKNLTPYAEGLTSSRTQYACGEKAKGQKGPSVCRPAKEAKKYTKAQIKKAVEIKNKGGVVRWSEL